MKAQWRLRLTIVPPALLALAHLAAAVALLGFGLRTGAYPFHPRALRLYGLAVPLTVAAIVWLVRRGSHLRPETMLDLVLVSAPALASLALVGTLWLSPWLGGAPYAPYDMQDYDAVLILSQVPALAFCAIAIAYGSPGFLLIAGGGQLLVYFGTHALPHLQRYPAADLLGVHPAIANHLFAVYAVSLMAALLRRWLLPRVRPGLGLAAAVATLLGGYVFFSVLSALPGNGDYVGYLSTVPRTGPVDWVPTNAWDMWRPVAFIMASVAMTGAVFAPLLAHFSAARPEVVSAQVA